MLPSLVWPPSSCFYSIYLEDFFSGSRLVISSIWVLKINSLVDNRLVLLLILPQFDSVLNTYRAQLIELPCVIKYVSNRKLVFTDMDIIINMRQFCGHLNCCYILINYFLLPYKIWINFAPIINKINYLSGKVLCWKNNKIVTKIYI